MKKTRVNRATQSNIFNQFVRMKSLIAIAYTINMTVKLNGKNHNFIAHELHILERARAATQIEPDNPANWGLSDRTRESRTILSIRIGRFARHGSACG